MARPDPVPTQLDRDLAELKLLEIAQHYREVLDDAARKGCSMLEVLATLIGTEQTARQQRALERRLRQARLPKQKTLADYNFNFPKRVPKTATRARQARQPTPAATTGPVFAIKTGAVFLLGISLRQTCSQT